MIIDDGYANAPRIWESAGHLGKHKEERAAEIRRIACFRASIGAAGRLLTISRFTITLGPSRGQSDRITRSSHFVIHYEAFSVAATRLVFAGNGKSRLSNEMITLPRKMRVERDSKYFRTSLV